MLNQQRKERFQDLIYSASQHIEKPECLVSGTLVRITGMTLEVRGLQSKVGSHCEISLPDHTSMEAEVVGFDEDRTFLMAVDKDINCSPGARVLPKKDREGLPVGEELIGRVLDGNGCLLDGGPPLAETKTTRLTRPPVNPLQRGAVREQLDVGVRAINSLLTVGQGQRIGIFAGSGVGKSVLLGMMTRYTQAEITVVALIGERGREVKEFIDDTLGPEGLRNTIVIAAPADFSPLQRIHAAMYATAIAEYFRDRGKQVLLLMDSLTRYAQAHREIALSVGQAPATRGYPSSVFAKLPELVERAGSDNQSGGAITAFYTVLAEHDDMNDPVVDTSRAILDGHITLSREYAEAGHYPAIDIEASISRVMNNIVSPAHIEQAQLFRMLFSKYRENKDVIQLGIYQAGGDAEIDQAIAYYPKLAAFLQQDVNQACDMQSTMSEMGNLWSQ